MITYREMHKTDIDACIDITKANWGENVASRTREELTNPGDAYYLVGWDDETQQVVGYAGYRPSWMMFGVWEFVWINIDPKFQKKGIGRDLTNLRISDVKRRGGAYIMLMTRQWDFFRKFGFETMESISDTNKMCWVLMRKNLGPLPFDTTTKPAAVASHA